MNKIILILMILQSAHSYASTLLNQILEHCPPSQDFEIHRQLPNGATFPYTFQYKCKNPLFPTIIYIPGGPGQGSINKKNSLELIDANLILTDPRGVNINNSYFKAGGTKEDLSSHQVAMDIIEIIKTFPYSQKFIIYGHSYGTVVATHIGSELNKLDPAISNKVQSIILSGSFGRSLESGEQAQTTNSALSKLYQYFTTNQDKLTHQSPFSQNLNHILINNYDERLFTLLSQGLPQTVNYLTNATIDEINTAAKNDGDLIKSSEISLDFYQSIACNELTSTGITKSVLENGYFKISNPSEGTCKNSILKNKYDSKNFQISKPIFYISGGQDTLTDIKQYQYHFNNQIQSQQKISICDRNRGHNVVDLLSQN